MHASVILDYQADRVDVLEAGTPNLKSQIIIRKHTHLKPHHPRTHLVEENDPMRAASSSSVPTFSQPPDNEPTTREGEDHAERQDSGTPSDELTRIRMLLRPPPMPGVDDWGIPPEPQGDCDPEIEARSLHLTMSFRPLELI